MSDVNFNSPGYLFGQVLATRSLLMQLAGLTVDRGEFRDCALAALETLRNSAMPQPVPDAVLSGIDDTETWLRQMTD